MKIMFLYRTIIKNVSSFTTHKKTPSLRLSLWEFKKSLPKTLIYESILIKIYMNANIMNTQTFDFIKYVYFNLNLHFYFLWTTFCPCLR